MMQNQTRYSLAIVLQVFQSLHRTFSTSLHLAPLLSSLTELYFIQLEEHPVQKNIVTAFSQMLPPNGTTKSICRTFQTFWLILANTTFSNDITLNLFHGESTINTFTTTLLARSSVSKSVPRENLIILFSFTLFHFSQPFLALHIGLNAPHSTLLRSSWVLTYL